MSHFVVGKSFGNRTAGKWYALNNTIWCFPELRAWDLVLSTIPNLASWLKPVPPAGATPSIWQQPQQCLARESCREVNIPRWCSGIFFGRVWPEEWPKSFPPLIMVSKLSSSRDCKLVSLAGQLIVFKACCGGWLWQLLRNPACWCRNNVSLLVRDNESHHRPPAYCHSATVPAAENSTGCWELHLCTMYLERRSPTSCDWAVSEGSNLKYEQSILARPWKAQLYAVCLKTHRTLLPSSARLWWPWKGRAAAKHSQKALTDTWIRHADAREVKNRVEKVYEV